MYLRALWRNGLLTPFLDVGAEISTTMNDVRCGIFAAALIWLERFDGRMNEHRSYFC